MAKDNDNIGGVWRTISGRRVFIKDGQDLATAMIESGKFKNIRKNYKNEISKLQQEKKDLKEANKRTSKAIDQTISQYGNAKNDLERKMKKEQWDLFLSKSKEEIKQIDSINNMLNKNKIEEARYEKAIGEYTGGKDYGEKMKKTGNDYLPKAKKVETAGTSNRKEVSDNIQAHILEYYDNPVDFMKQMDVFNNMPTRWHAGQEMAKQGFYDIYYDDQREFLESLNINPKGKSFSDDRVFQTYSSLIGRESERLYNRLEKLYNQYKAEHKNSDVSLDDFRKWFK